MAASQPVAANEMLDFPPFYSIQPNAETWAKQRALWCELILSHCRDNKLHKVDLNEMAHSPLFNNQKLQRRVSTEMARLLFEQLVQQGNAEWEGADKTRCLIIWRTVDEWANLIYTWVQESGLTGSVLTLYELLHGEDSAGAAFHDLDPAVLRKALAALEKRGKAQMFAGSTPDAEGVKFFA